MNITIEQRLALQHGIALRCIAGRERAIERTKRRIGETFSRDFPWLFSFLLTVFSQALIRWVGGHCWLWLGGGGSSLFYCIHGGEICSLLYFTTLTLLSGGRLRDFHGGREVAVVLRGRDDDNDGI